MSQTTSSQGWFTQLQKQYPTSALVTELVQIHQERFIVKAIVQISGVAIATSMAESASLETAEDQARLRVLDLLGIAVISATSNLDSLTAPEPLPAPIDRDRVSETPLSELSSAAIRQPIDNGFPINTPSNLDLEAIVVPPPLALPTVSLPEVSIPEVSIPEVSIPEVSADLSMPFSTALFSTEVMPAENNSDETVNNFEEEYLPSVEDYGAGYEDEPADASIGDSLIAAETAAIAPTESLQENNFPARLNADTPKKAIAPETPVISAPADATEPDDLSTLIAHTDIEMDRIGWTKQEGRDYLKRTYKKSTRQRLDVDELMDFLHYLRALPSVNGI